VAPCAAIAAVLGLIEWRSDDAQRRADLAVEALAALLR
jgi:hypothetical protein